MLGSAESEHPMLISHEIIVEVFQAIWPRYLNYTQTDRQTDGWTDDFPWQYSVLRSIAR